jgi:hypothetical protein
VQVISSRVVYYCKEEMEEKDTEEDATDNNEMKERGIWRRMTWKMGRWSKRHAVMK